MTEESAVKVCVRVRPLIEREEAANAENAEPVQLYWRADRQTIHQLDDGNVTKSFSFDRVFSAQETTKQLYQDIAKSLVVSTVEGYNGTIFAYGQTSSGKTFTMMGNSCTPGVIPLAMDDVFQTIKTNPRKEFLLRVSYMEIYNETVTDLLCDSWKRKPLEIREGNYKNVYVADLTEELVTTPEQALAWIRKGEKNRHYGKTKMNERSSRSHTIFRMIIESRELSDPSSGEISDGAIIVSHLNLVDLAGAERASQTGAEGTRFKEGCNINRSLFTLGQVIKKLSDENQKGFTNYRDSKLTRILQNSLGGNAKTVIVCTITPAVQDETLSTLQFASAAKRMKNDPHVTEVSDDGALLRRYRNEINELKQRLQEVSSVTKTTVTEKQTLCQLLQEKEQLQREQEDRIRNLTKLLVTASNVVPIKKLPKRRMTWGGKLLQAAAHTNAASESGVLEPFVKQRRIDLSTVVEQDDMEEFDGRWDIPLERTFDLDLNQSTVTTRNSSESDYFSPRSSDLNERLVNMEEQLEKETQLRQEVQKQLKNEAQDKQDLHLQLEKEAQEKQQLHLQLEKEAQEKQALHLQLEKEAQEKQDLHLQLEIETQEKQNLHLQLEREAQEKQQLHLQLNKEAPLKQKLDLQLEEIPDKEELDLQHEIERMELQQQLEVEVLNKQEAVERALELERKVFELEQQLEGTSHNTSNYASEQFKRDLGDSIQLCESLAFEKERLEAECDQLKKELQTCGEEIERQTRDSMALREELVQKKDLDEFQCLEEESKREYEQELLAEIATLKKATEDSKIEVQQLKAELGSLSELQGDKDLVQEVQRLRRSLDDAECLSRETKKEWAFLRSENISLKERDDELSVEHQRMQTELQSVQAQLEAEKTRFKKMQMDLQKELMGAFDENTKLTTLLDGKVPKNLVDGVLLERTVADLRKDLEQHKHSSEELQTQLELQKQQETEEKKQLEQKVDCLSQQVCELTGHLCEVQTERDELLSAQQSSQERQRQELQSAHEQTEQLREELQKTQDLLQEAFQKAQEHRDQEVLKALEQQREFEVKLQQNQEMLTKELQRVQEQLQSVQQDLQRVQDQETILQQELLKTQEKLQQDNEKHQQELLSNQEQHQQNLLKAHEHQQEELQKATELLHQNLKNSQDEQENLQLELQKALEEKVGLQQDLQNAQEQLQQELQRVQEQLQNHVIFTEPGVSSEEVERLRSDLSTLTVQRAELQEILEGVREEKNQLKRDLEESVDMCVQTQSELQQLQSKLAGISNASDEQVQQLNQELEKLKKEKQQLQADLQENVDMMIENQTELREALDKVKELEGQLVTTSRTSAQVPQATENSLQATAELDRLRTEVISLTAERDQLKCEIQGEGGQKAQELEALQQQLHVAQEAQTQKEGELQKIKEQLQDIHERAQETQQQQLLHAQEQQSQLEEKLQRAEELLQQELHSGSDRQERLQQKLQKAEEQQDALQHQLHELQEQQQQKEEELSRRQEQMEELERELQHTQEMLQQQLCNIQLPYQENQAPLQQELHQAQVEQQQQELQMAQKQHREELLKAQQQQQSLEKELSTTLEQQLNLEKDLQKAQEHLEQLQQELQESRQQRSQDVQKAQEQQQHFEEELRKNEELLHQELQRAQLEQVQLQEELQKVQEQLDDRCTPQPLEEATGELERLSSDLRSSTAQREELQEILEGLREEKNQLKRDLDMAQHQLQELDELRQEKTQMQLDLQSSTTKAAELEAQLRCVTEERQRLLGDNEAAQNLQKKMDQLQSEISSLTADREQLQERLMVGEKRHSQELQELSAQRTHLFQKENSEELERLRSDLSTLTAQRDELQEILGGVREEKNKLKRDLEENLDMAQQHLNELEEIRLEKTQLQSDLHNNMERADKLEAQLRCVTEERQRLLGDNEAAQTLQKKMDQLQSEISSLTADREQLQERLEGEKRHSQELQELNAQRTQLFQQQTVAALENSEELERLRSDLSTLTAQRDELQEILGGVREEKNQLERDLEENLDIVQQHLNELEEMRLEKTRLQSDLHNNMERANKLEAQLQCVTEERQRLLGDNEAAQILQKKMDQLQSEISSLTADREQLQERLEGEKRHSQDLQELSAQRMQLFQQQTVAALENSQELERLRSDLSTLTAQRDELQEILGGVREEKNKLKRDLEKTLDMRMKEEMTPKTTYPDHTQLVAQENESQEKLKAWSLRMQRLSEQISHKLDECWTTKLLASAKLTQRRLIYGLLPQFPHLQSLGFSLKKSTRQVEDLLWTRLVLLEKLVVAYRSHYEALWQQEAPAVEQSGLMAQKNTSRQPCSPDDVLLCFLLERRELRLQEMTVVVQRLENGLTELENALNVEVQLSLQANQRFGELSSCTPGNPGALNSHLQQETSRRLRVAGCERTICQVLRSEHLRVHNSREKRCQMATPQSLTQTAASEIQQDDQQLGIKLQQALTHTQAVENKLQHLQEAHNLSSQQCSIQQLQLKELQDKLAHAQTLAQSRMTPSVIEMQNMKDQLMNMELQNSKLNTTHQQELERLMSVLKHKEELIHKLREDLRMKQQDEHSYIEECHSKQSGHQEKNQQLQQKIAQLESQLSSQKEDIDRWKRRAYKLKESRREGGLHTPTKRTRPPTPTRHTPTKHALPLTPSKRPALGETPLLNSPQRPLLDSPKSLFFDMPPGTHGPPLARTKGFFDDCALGSATGSTEGGRPSKNDEWWAQSSKQSQQCETQ